MRIMLLFIDTETNGLPKSASHDFERWPRVVQLAWSLYDQDGIRESVHSFIKSRRTEKCSSAREISAIPACAVTPFPVKTILAFP